MDNQTFVVIWDKVRGQSALFPDVYTKTSGVRMTLDGQEYVVVAGTFGYLLNTEEVQRTAQTLAFCRVIPFTCRGGSTRLQFIRVGQFESAHDGVRWNTPDSHLARNSVRDRWWSAITAL